MGIKATLENCPLTAGLYAFLREKKHKRIRNRRTAGKYNFFPVKKDREKMCMILAGYKPYLYEITFERLKRFMPDDIDVCLITSGKFMPELKKTCEENGWSYLSTKRNNVCLAQNIAIALHPAAQYIYKIDEDIFITKHFFQTLLETYRKEEKEGDYYIGFVAPLIPVGYYSYLRVLKKLGLQKDYESRFERPKFDIASINSTIEGRRKIYGDPNTAIYMWGGGGSPVPDIDSLDEMFYRQAYCVSVCPTRFNIGAILFTRSTWEEMDCFDVTGGAGMSGDEIKLCRLGADKSKAIIVSENTLVGHLSFSPQNEKMKEYFFSHKDRFQIKEVSEKDAQSLGSV